jgi:chitinase
MRAVSRRLLRVFAVVFAVALSGCSGITSGAPGNSGNGNNGNGNGNGGNGNGGNGNGNGNGTGGGGGDVDMASSVADMGQAAGDMSSPPDSALPPASKIEYAPYFYTWGWGDGSYAFSSLAQMQKIGGPSAVTIAFVLANNGCHVTTDIHDNLDDVKAFVAGGGHVKASFGGADGTYLEYSCSDASSLAAAIASFVDDTGITDLDFDIEQGTKSSNSTINAMRAAALKSVQDSRHIRVAFTLPVNPDGLDDLGLAIVKSALAAGVTISFVNVMTMDYGNGTNLGSTPTTSVDATAAQLQGMIKGLSPAAAYRMIGATPMVGHNDDTEVFSLDNAKTLISYAKQKQIGLVAFWAIQRDEKCPSSKLDLNLCNGVSSATFQFSQIFASVLN